MDLRLELVVIPVSDVDRARRSTWTSSDFTPTTTTS